MDDLNEKYRATTVIVAAQIITIIVLTVVAWLNLFTFESTASPSTITILWLGIIFIAVGSFILRRSFFNWEKLTNTALFKGRKGLLNRLQLNAVILSAFADLIAIIGFVITILSADKYQMLRAGAIALVVCLINFPRRQVWTKIVGNLEKLDFQE